jgi:hypothetical protein
MQNHYIAPGHWEIDTYTVKRWSHSTWQISDGEGMPLAEVVSLDAAREWIAADIDKVDLGMHPGEEVETR